MIILASTSTTRQRLLTQAGVSFHAVKADIDERSIESNLTPTDPPQIAMCLAEAKALSVSARDKITYVVGADQILACQGHVFHKPRTQAEAKKHLQALRGHSHTLHTAMCIASAGQILERHTSTSCMSMRHFTDAFIDDYLSTQPAAVWMSPGCYRYEQQGIQFFDKIEGDMHSILGLPLLPLLDFLRRKAILPS